DATVGLPAAAGAAAAVVVRGRTPVDASFWGRPLRDATYILYLDAQGTLILFVGLMEKLTQMSVCFVLQTGSSLQS
ncbi:Hypothetical predicted protein, partial [Podarcis lilfordi]